ncbi:MAG: 4Fe-4S binding protein [Armatimonadetes bacterium]|nr:4Fe-4S binding protein [Armatimonadota bacterium]
MKEIVVISGKGGTGKTSITASFAFLANEDIVVADCDVDAADMHLLLQPDYEKSEDFHSGVLAEIDQDKCVKCGKCAEVCRFDAIPKTNSQYIVNPLDCEGCGYCCHICPTDAILMKEQNVGKCYISNTRMNNKMVHARLNIGAENSGKLVAKVKNEAKKLAEKYQKEFVLVDGSPGIGCPVISSLSGADLVVFVTEPTISAFHDLRRVYELVDQFKIQTVCILNKSDLNENISQEIQDFMRTNKISLLSSLPYDDSFTKAMIEGKTITEFNDDIKMLLEISWNQIKQIISKK